MNFNYSYEKKKFEQEWAKLEKEYGQAGMSDKDIQEMKNFDYDCFKLNRNTVLHTYDLQFCNDFDDNGKVVWRCISRLDYGKKYCKHSPSIEESVLQNAIMDAILKISKENADVLKILKSHIAMGLNADNINDNSIELQIRLSEIEAEWKIVIGNITTENQNDSDIESQMEKLLAEKNQIKKQLEEIETLKMNKQLTMSRLDEIYSVIDLLRNHPLTYDEQIVREILECVVVESKSKIKVVFKGGYSASVLLNH